jgi:glucan phosphoethanolaminetransferase (alkaline phosphatase superfamily)
MTIELFFTSLFWFVMAVLFAAVEIEIEGKHGWAEKTHTWFRTQGIAARIYGFFMGGKPLTGYHAIMFALPLIMFHAHFFMGVSWSLARELLVLAIYFAWAPIWDYLWFVLNPYYGVGGFKKNAVWWHAKSHWLFRFTPFDYLVGWGISSVLAGVAAWIAKDNALFAQHVQFLLWFLVFLSVTIVIIAPVYKRWHAYMRKHDDRPSSGIFHHE